MTEQRIGKLNWLERNVPEGLLVDAAWLERHGYYGSLRSQYVSAGWLEQPARAVYTRSRGALKWEQVVISLQTLLQYPLHVGGRTALELAGHAHYLKHEQKEVHLYGMTRFPGWVDKLPMPVRFFFHRTARLFPDDPPMAVPDARPAGDHRQTFSPPKLPDSLTTQSWGQWDWPLVLSSSERALLELLDELPARESFHQVDKLMEGLVNLRPRRLQALLRRCKSVKVKRLFFFLAARHGHQWLKHIERDDIDLGKGKRVLVKGGKLDPTYLITVPEDLDGLQ